MSKNEDRGFSTVRILVMLGVIFVVITIIALLVLVPGKKKDSGGQEEKVTEASYGPLGLPDPPEMATEVAENPEETVDAWNQETDKKMDQEMSQGADAGAGGLDDAQSESGQPETRQLETGGMGSFFGKSGGKSMDDRQREDGKQKDDENPDASETESRDGDRIIVAIDPGHQGKNLDISGEEPIGPGSSEMKAKNAAGTSGCVSGLDEYELNLAVSLKLKDELEKRGYEVVMTRSSDEEVVSNVERAEIANQSGASILIRVHANGSEDSNVSGALTMSPSAENPYVGWMSQECCRLSQIILDKYCEAVGLANLGVMASDDMTGINWSQIPVTIIEMGFMTNPGDDSYMADESNQYVMACGIADGVDAYFGKQQTPEG